MSSSLRLVAALLLSVASQRALAAPEGALPPVDVRVIVEIEDFSSNGGLSITLQDPWRSYKKRLLPPGELWFEGLPPGDYDVTAELPGARPARLGLGLCSLGGATLTLSETPAAWDRPRALAFDRRQEDIAVQRIVHPGLAVSFWLPAHWDLDVEEGPDLDGSTPEYVTFKTKTSGSVPPTSSTATGMPGSALVLTVRATGGAAPSSIGFDTTDRGLMLSAYGRASLVAGDGWFGLAGAKDGITRYEPDTEYRADLYSIRDARRARVTDVTDEALFALLLRSLCFAPLPTPEKNAAPVDRAPFNRPFTLPPDSLKPPPASRQSP